MTKEELAKVPFKCVSHMNGEHENCLTYMNEEYDFGMCVHTLKKENGGFGKRYTHYRFGNKVAKSLTKFLEMIKDVEFKGDREDGRKLQE